ncbi:MAG: adenylyl-sulfate kinase [Clostridia bacterium]|nr:adenylyl-sulfate kinase [Clostridia bacterium]
MTKEANILPNGSFIVGKRQRLFKQKSYVLWFTGLSGAGKSTLAYQVKKELHKLGLHSYVLDGDKMRCGLNKDLGFTPKDRTENIRRIAEVAKLFVDVGLIALVAVISPYESDRQISRTLFKQGQFLEIYVKCSLRECEARDPKGLYKKVREGHIKEFTGITSPYEHPREPDLAIDTEQMTVEESVHIVLSLLRTEKLI